MDFGRWITSHPQLVPVIIVAVIMIMAAVILFTMNGPDAAPLDTDDLIQKRISELRSIEKKLSKIMKRGNRAGFLLSTVQFLIGALTSTALVPQFHISSEVAGLLGVLLVVAAAFQQRYRPYSNAAKAEQSIAYLRSVSRHCENDLVLKRPPEKVLGNLTKAIDVLERMQAADPDSRLDDTQQFSQLETQLRQSLEGSSPNRTDSA